MKGKEGAEEGMRAMEERKTSCKGRERSGHRLANKLSFCIDSAVH